MFFIAFLSRYRSLILASLAAVWLGGAAFAQVGLGLAPMREELALAPGTAHSGVLTLANDGPDKMRVVAELLDFYLDQSATPQFGPNYPREAEFSCRQWLTVNPMEMEMNGKSQIPIRYTVRVPQTATARGFYCSIGFPRQPTAGEVHAIGMRAAVQI